MAEEAQYSSDTGSNKRKYDEQPVPPRRPTGFSAPISSTSTDDGQAPISYNSVPPPAAEDVDAQVQSAKLRVQEIASRLLLNAGSGAGLGGYETKRARVENGGGFDSPNLDGKPAIHSAPSAIPVYNFPQNSSKKIDVPNGRVGVIIGKSGETIKNLQVQSGAKIQVTRDMDADRTSLTRPVELTGTPEQIARAEQLISDVLAEAEVGGSGLATRRMTSQAGSEQFVMRIPNNKVGLVIGKGGETIKSMQASTGARIQVVPLHPPPGDTSTERSVHIDGTPEQIEAAKQLVNDAISENRMRNSSMSGGGYNQGYQARPQTTWGAAPQMQQQAGAYGYVQPGAYPGGAPQYGSQGQYGGYPTQAATGGYGGYDQSTAAMTAQQQGASGGGYDYYNQQQQQPPSQQNTSGQGDQSAAAGGYNNNYNTSQAPAVASYPQQGSYYGGYSAPQSGYAQYDQGGYGGYGGTQDASGYGAQGGDASKAPAPAPPATSQGYGPPPTQKPPVYGQSQQSPTTPGGGYGQAPAAAQAQASGYPPPAYGGAPAYGGPPPPSAPQTGYGQQQQQSPYGSGYGSSAYPQAPPAYYGDGSGTAPSASQTTSVAATTAPKASPKS